MNDGCAYVALGSSFVAGPGLRPRATPSPRAAGRSAINYPHLVALRLGLELDDRSFCGATIAQIAGIETSCRAAPQVEGVGPDIRLVTLTGAATTSVGVGGEITEYYVRTDAAVVVVSGLSEVVTSRQRGCQLH